MSSAPYGTWTSPISAANLAKASVRLGDVVVDSVAGKVYHIESRPSEGGRCVLVDSDASKDVVGKDLNVRTGVHEYGGAAAVVSAGVAYFSNIIDGRVYKVKNGDSNAIAVTPESTIYRYADFDIHPTNSDIIVSILEDHTDSTTPASVLNKLCIINTKTQAVSILVTGADFYASPRFSPDGSRVVWQQWSLPYMPWQSAEIHLADFSVDTCQVTNSKRIAGDGANNSVTYPAWATASTLLFTSDVSGYQNPWKYDVKTHKATALLSSPIPEDFGQPGWMLGQSPFAVIDNGAQALFSAFRGGRAILYLIDCLTGSHSELANPYVGIQAIHAVDKQSVTFIGERVDSPPELVICSINPLKFSVVSPTSVSAPSFPKALYSVAQPITLKAGPDLHPVHVVYFPPTNPDYVGTSISDERPPCVVYAHGGPTSFAGHALDMTTQYYTSRGWAWLNVNFGGSSGYGRGYIERLATNWGIVDIEDCIQAAKILSQPPYSLIDPKRTIIRGGSSGGFTALGAISMGSDLTTFAAATSSYGISDLRKLLEDTHKFESGYPLGLLGGDNKQVPEVYKGRSPVTHADKIVAPLLILQGEIDRVVPKEQAEIISKSIEQRGGVVEYKLYPGEGHGFRKEETIIDALERELAFYDKHVLGIHE
ncbi:Peptidase-S9 domain-containing protein [Mycena indigotica]|uniref:Peptidase-S9 domain-containing protein n=1 Tax=Mycena indigotica TaxID=2126181 RepID=A0A8H6WI19_9AGAR|nr:Peptidase-S9 domain-containing protein [Mycena indigotica]KAF7315663.1 Peptidase-S9 domain-containing protein [Mycena indigotica]